MKDKKHYWDIVRIALILPIVFAILDLIGASMWNKLGGWNGIAYTTVTQSYQTLFWTFAYIIIFGIGITYYFITKDKSETAAIIIIPFILLQMGAEDVFFYFIGGHELWTVTLPWLTGNLIIPTWISQILGEAVITGPIIILSAAIGYAISIILAKKLVKIKP